MIEHFSSVQKQQMTDYKDKSIPLISESEIIKNKINELATPTILDNKLYGTIYTPFTKNINRYKTLGELSYTVTFCDDGNYYDKVNKKCVACPLGSFCLNATSEKCKPGYYQDETGQTSCKPAPINTYTNINGATSYTGRGVDAAGTLDAGGPMRDGRRCDAAFELVLLVEAEGRVPCPSPARAVAPMRFGIVGLGIGRGTTATKRTGTIVGDEQDDGVVEFAGFFEISDETPHFLIDAVDETRISGHET